MEKTMKRYGVNHCFSTSYHPQTSGQVENTNKALKRILEKTVKDNPAIWSRKLDDALWAFCTAYKTPTDLIAAGKKRMFQLHELDELRHQAYENSRLYKERTKVWHDRKLRMRKEFTQGNKFRVNAADTKLQLLTELQLLKDYKWIKIANEISIDAIDGWDGMKRGYQGLCLGEMFVYLNKKDALDK
ncbi:reverse transcriptase domain-containing protein [Tanacetum coccineum]